MIVLQEEDLRRLVALSKNESFVRVPLATGTVAEINHDRFVRIGIPRRTRSVVTDAHGVTSGVKRLRRQHQGVQVEIVGLLGVPPAVGHATKHADDVQEVKASNISHRVFTVGGKYMVLRSRRKSGTNLRRLLANARHPQSHMALPLEVSRFDIEAPHHGHHPIKLTEICLSQMRDGLVILVKSVTLHQGAILIQEPKRRIRVRHTSNLAAALSQGRHSSPTKHPDQRRLCGTTR